MVSPRPARPAQQAAAAHLHHVAGGDAPPALEALFKVDCDGGRGGVVQAPLIAPHLIVPLVAAWEAAE